MSDNPPFWEINNKGDESPTTNKLRQLHRIDTGNLGAIKRFESFQIKTWPTIVYI